MFSTTSWIKAWISQLFEILSPKYDEAVSRLATYPFPKNAKIEDFELFESRNPFSDYVEYYLKYDGKFVVLNSIEPFLRESKPDLFNSYVELRNDLKLIIAQNTDRIHSKLDIETVFQIKTTKSSK